MSVIPCHRGGHLCNWPACSKDCDGRPAAGVVSRETIEKIKDRKYECFMNDHEPKPWTPGQCAGFAGKGSRALHLFRCKRRSGHGIGALFCAQHAKTQGGIEYEAPEVIRLQAMLDQMTIDRRDHDLALRDAIQQTSELETTLRDLLEVSFPAIGADPDTERFLRQKYDEVVDRAKNLLRIEP